MSQICATGRGLLMDGASAASRVIAPAGFHHAAFAVQIFRPHPIGKSLVRSVLTPSFRCHIQIPVRAQELFPSAPIRRVGVEDLAGVVFKENAIARAVLQPGVGVLVVVEGAPRRATMGRVSS